MRWKLFRLMSVCVFVPLVTWGAAAGGPAFKLYDPGSEEIVDYGKYGLFCNSGTKDYSYVITNRAGLAKASGEGIDPSLTITNNPDYRKAKAEGKLDKADHWKLANASNPQLAYFVWNNAPVDPGVRLLFVGKAMEKAGHYIHALKAYRAAMVFYPDSAGWSAGNEFQWDVATASWNAIINLLRDHPELNIRMVGADVVSRSDKFGLTVIVTPGRLERIPAVAETAAEEAQAEPAAAPAETAKEGEPAPPSEPKAAAVAEVSPEEDGQPDIESILGDPNAVIMQRGTGTVHLVQYGDGGWQVVVEGKPYFVRGMNYSPTKVGTIPWDWNWLWADGNTNGIVDCFEVWVDANKNGKQDSDEPTIPDFQLLKEMGCNTIKLYITDPELPNFNYLVMRKMFHDHGIRVIVGNFLGAYCHGSGANWDAGTDYTLGKQRENMKASVSNLVMRLKDEPWVLAWVLGNENNMEMSGDVNATRTNASKYPETYARFLNEICKMIHKLDPNHPVGTGNLLTGLVEYYGRYAPELDFIGINSYLGEEGFGATWQKIKQTMNRPAMITEFGCDSYFTEKGPDEEMQVRYLLRNWEDIRHNSRGRPGAGNAIGGFVFEWLDEWWKDTLNYFEDSVTNQSDRAVFPMPFPDGFAQEEWFGIMAQGAGRFSPYQRVPKKAYVALQEQWLKEEKESGKEE